MKQYTPRFDSEWKEMITFLPEDRQPEMENAIRLYQTDGTEPSGLDGAEMMAFLLIKKIIDRRRRQREARLRKKASCEVAANPKPETHEPHEINDTSEHTAYTERTEPRMPQPATLTDNGDIYGHLRKLRRADRNLKRKKKKVRK